jgi:hypothetical protein
VQLVSRLATGLTILLAFILLPKQINSLFRVMETWTKYLGTVDLHKDERHVVVSCAALTVDNIEMFLAEFYHKDHAPRNHNTKVILVDPDPPPHDVLALMEDAAYYRRVAFLQGSLIEDRTLERLRLETCRAVFVIADKLAADPAADDQRAMLRGLAMIKYLQMHHTRVFTAVQLHHPDLLPRVAAAGVDQCMSLRQLTGALLAQSCVTPAFSTLALNLVTSYSGGVAIDLYDDREAAHWLDEYYYGASHELYEVLLPDHASGWAFHDLARHVYRAHAIVLLGCETADSSGHGFDIVLNPASYVLRRGDRVIAMARCEADAQHVTRILRPRAVSTRGSHDAIDLVPCVH